MKSARLSICETLKYQREMIVKIPEEISESELNNWLDEAQRKAQHPEDVLYILQDFNKNIEAIEMPDNDFDSPYNTEIEIDELDIEDMEETQLSSVSN